MPPKRKRNEEEEKNKSENNKKTNKKSDTDQEKEDSSSSSSSDDSSSSSSSDESSSDDSFIVDDDKSSSDDQSESKSSDSSDSSGSNDDESSDDFMDKNKFKGMLIIPLSNFFGPNFGQHNNEPDDKEKNNEDEFDDDGADLQPPTRLNLRKRKVPPPPKSKKPIKRRKVDITENIKTLDDLLEIIDKYEDIPHLEYPVDMEKLKALKEPIKELQNLVGMKEIKSQILDQIMFLLSQLQDDDQMLHTVLYGPPGSGKSTLGLILSKIYQALGFSNGKFRIVKRSDLIAGYLGQTALKTQRLFNETSGGVIFIDEAYSLGNAEGRDSFSKEAIDTINQNLTEMKTKIICIIAGYKEELDKCFFSVNPGLNRRFPFRYEIKSYGYEELAEIFHRKITLSGWTVDPVPLEIFNQNKNYFTQKGGDMEILSQMSKLAYSRRTFGKHQDPPKHLTLRDVEEGLKLFKMNDEVKNRPNDMDNEAYFDKYIRPSMYH